MRIAVTPQRTGKGRWKRWWGKTKTSLGGQIDMIWESRFWKDELLANARALKRVQSKRRTERRSFVIERAVFLSVYIMRKLWEAGKLSTSWETTEIPCNFYALKGEEPDWLNWHRIDEHFDLGAPRSSPLRTIELCHRLIHSFVFAEDEGQKKTIAGFFFTSDRTKRRGLWYVNFRDFLHLLKITGDDYPASVHLVRHPKTGVWLRWAGEGAPPIGWEKELERRAGKYALD